MKIGKSFYSLQNFIIIIYSFLLLLYILYFQKFSNISIFTELFFHKFDFPTLDFGNDFPFKLKNPTVDGILNVAKNLLLHKNTFPINPYTHRLVILFSLITLHQQELAYNF